MTPLPFDLPTESTRLGTQQHAQNHSHCRHRGGLFTRRRLYGRDQPLRRRRIRWWLRWRLLRVGILSPCRKLRSEGADGAWGMHLRASNMSVGGPFRRLGLEGPPRSRSRTKKIAHAARLAKTGATAAALQLCLASAWMTRRSDAHSGPPGAPRPGSCEYPEQDNPHLCSEKGMTVDTTPRVSRIAAATSPMAARRGGEDRDAARPPDAAPLPGTDDDKDCE